MKPLIDGVTFFPGKSDGPTTLIVGLVHGNEIVGTHILDYIYSYASKGTHRGCIITLLANPAAHKNNVRYIDTDLNRSFAPDGLPVNTETQRAREIMNFFAGTPIDYIFDIHSTPSRSDPMILCSGQDQSFSLAKKFPIQRVVRGLIDKVEGISLLNHFVGSGSVGIAFEAGCHEDPQTIATGISIAQIILSLHEGEEVPDVSVQDVIAVTDVMYVSDFSFQFSKNYQGFEEVPAGEIRGVDSTGTHSFSTDKILLMPNTKFQDDLHKQPKTRLVYFGERQ